MPESDRARLGAGPGGYVSAIRAAQLGARVAIVEDDLIGGTCLNWGCIPTKALIKSGRVAAQVRNAAQFGVSAGDVSLDYAAMNARKDKVVNLLREGIEAIFKKRKVEVFRGFGRVTSPNAIEVEGRDGSKKTVEAEHLLIATGSEPARPKMFPFDHKLVVTSEEAVIREELPESVLVVGGGFIGCEYASLYANLGLEVTIVEMLDSILATMDEIVIKEVTRGLKKRKIKVRTGVKVSSMQKTDGKVKATLEDGTEITAGMALVSVGRRPVTSGIGLEEAGVKLENGYVIIDERCRTSVPSVYAIGDITGKLQLAHVASEQGIVAVENMKGRDAKMDYGVIPACVFTDPEAAVVGLTEREAAEKGLDYGTGVFPFRVLGKAHSDGEIDGSAKVVCEKGTGKVLGVHVVTHGASEIIGEAALAMKAGLKAEDVINTIHAHPTLPEGIREAMEDFEGRAIHLISARD